MTKRILVANLNENAEWPEEAIARACIKAEDNGHTPEFSTFFISRNHWLGLYRRITPQVEHTAAGYRMVFATWCGVVYVVADKTMKHDNNNEYHVYAEWSEGTPYEECIRQGELWMQRALDCAPDKAR